MKEFFQILQYLLATNSIYIIAGDFNCDIFKVSERKYIFTDHVQMVNKPTHNNSIFYRSCPYQESFDGRV